LDSYSKTLNVHLFDGRMEIKHYKGKNNYKTAVTRFLDTEGLRIEKIKIILPLFHLKNQKQEIDLKKFNNNQNFSTFYVILLFMLLKISFK